MRFFQPSGVFSSRISRPSSVAHVNAAHNRALRDDRYERAVEVARVIKGNHAVAHPFPGGQHNAVNAAGGRLNRA
jgi:hypothetical protein